MDKLDAIGRKRFGRINTYMVGCAMAKVDEKLPEWTEEAGGRTAWEKWVDDKVDSCEKRAKKWAAKRNKLGPLPTRGEWRAAIRSAIKESGGVGRYSRLNLSLEDRKNTDWNWPSVEHLAGSGTANLGLETRLVNDMKTIMSEAEFIAMVGHLALTFGISAARLSSDWRCSRSFAVEQPDDEPPLELASNDVTT
jgi:hypothetical protein